MLSSDTGGSEQVILRGHGGHKLSSLADASRYILLTTGRKCQEKRRGKIRTEAVEYLERTALSSECPRDGLSMTRMLLSLLTVLLGLTPPLVALEINRDPAYHITRGESLAKGKKWAEAQAAYRLALELRPNYADAWAGLARLFEEQQESTQAAIALAEALRADSTCPPALMMRSERSLRQGKVDEALADINLVIVNRPEVVQALLVRAKLYLRQNQVDNAEKDLTQYLARNSNDVAAFRLRSQAFRQLGRIKDAIADLSQILRLEDKDVDTRTLRAKLLEETEMFAEAIEDYSALLKLRPENSDLFWKRAQALSRLSEEYAAKNARDNRWLTKQRECLADLEQFLRKNPSHQEALVLQGKCLYFLREFIKARDALRRATEVNARNLEAWRFLGLTYNRLDNLTEAVDCYTRILKLDPNQYRTYVMRASAYDQLDQQKDALDDANAAIALVEKYSYAYRTRGLIYSHQGKWADAEADYSRAIDLESADAMHWIERANTRRRQGKLTEALADLDKAAELEPQNVSVYTKRASFFVSQGKWTEAKAAHEKIVKLPSDDGNDTTQGYSRILILMLDHKYEEGLKLAEEYARKNTKDHSWLYDLACALAIGAEVASKDSKHPRAAELRQRMADRAVELLEQCVALGYKNFVHMRHDWDFNSLQGDPRFQKIARVPTKK